jgi:spermidine synthase
MRKLMLLTNCSHAQSPNIGRRTWLCSAAFILLVATVGIDSLSVQADDRNAGVIEHEVKSTYSHIRIRRSGSIRTMIFVRDNGEEAYESQMNLKSPHLLRFSYLQHMFTSYLIQPDQKKVLIVGLGGGSMVHFLQKHDPQCEVDAVEIDPVVVQLAERYFALKRSRNVRLLVADAFDYFAKNETKYDVIYMDAFLKPSESTDGTGVPLRLRTLDFYKQLQSRLNDGGSVVFNINPHPDMKADLATIAEAFPQAYVFSLPNSEGVVAIGSMLPTRMKLEELRAAGREMDKRFKSGFSFETLATHVRK